MVRSIPKIGENRILSKLSRTSDKILKFVKNLSVQFFWNPEKSSKKGKILNLRQYFFEKTFSLALNDNTDLNSKSP